MKLKFLLTLMLLYSFPLLALQSTSTLNANIAILFGLFIWIMASLLVLIFSIYQFIKTSHKNWVISIYVSYFSLFSIYLFFFWYFLSNNSRGLNSLKKLNSIGEEHYYLNDMNGKLNSLPSLRELETEHWRYIYIGLIFLALFLILIKKINFKIIKD